MIFVCKYLYTMASSVNNVLPTQEAKPDVAQKRAELIAELIEGFRPYVRAFLDGGFQSTDLTEVTIYQILLTITALIGGYAKDWQSKKLARDFVVLERLINPNFTSKSGREFSIVELVHTALAVCGDFADAEFAEVTWEQSYSFPKKDNFDKDYHLTHKEQETAIGEVTWLVVLIKLLRTNASRIIQMTTGGGYKLPTLEQCDKLSYTIDIGGNKIAKKTTPLFSEFMRQWLDVADMLEGFEKDLSDIVSIFKDASEAATREIEAKKERQLKREQQTGKKAWSIANLRKEVKVIKPVVPKPVEPVVRVPIPPPPKDCWGGKVNIVTGATIDSKPVVAPAVAPAVAPVTAPVVKDFRQPKARVVPARAVPARVVPARVAPAPVVKPRTMFELLVVDE